MIIVGGKRTRKSLELFRLASENNGVIITYDSERADNLNANVERLFGIKIRPVITMDDFLDKEKRKALFKKGILSENDNVYVEESFEIMYKLFSEKGLNLKGMTVGPGRDVSILVKELNEPEIEKMIWAGYPETECRIQKKKVEEI